MNKNLYAFWAHGSFPYCLGGEIIDMKPDGSVSTKEYGIGQYFKPIKILPRKAGQEIQDRLNYISAKYKEDQDVLKTKYQEKIHSFIETPYLLKNLKD